MSIQISSIGGQWAHGVKGPKLKKKRFQPQAGVEIKIETVSPKAKDRKNTQKRIRGKTVKRKTEKVNKTEKLTENPKTKKTKKGLKFNVFSMY